MKFKTLEYGRGIAASLVVFYHAARIVGEPRFFGVFPLWNLTLNFNAGVDFFFVLSGFVITYVHYRDIGNPKRLKYFLTQRITRIYPLYWCMLTAVLVMLYFVPSFGETNSITALRVLTSYILFPMPDHPIIGVAWSLVYEMFYYFIFSLLIIFGRIFFIVLLPYILLSVVTAISYASTEIAYPWNFLFSPNHLHFFLGALTGAFLDKISFKSTISIPLMIAAGVFLIALFSLDPSGHLTRQAFALCSALLLLLLAVWEKGSRCPNIAILSYLGSASYSIYLVHPLVGPAVVRILTKLPDTIMNPHLATICIAVSGIVAGLFVHYMFERRLISLIRNYSIKTNK